MTLNLSTLISSIAYPQAAITWWANSWQTTARSWFWWFSLILLGSLSHSLDIYMPWVAFAVIAGITLQRHKAIATTLLLWLFHDGLVDGIHSEASLMPVVLWVCCMGLAVVIVTSLSTLRPQFAQQSFTGHLKWIALSMGSGFLIFEGMTACFWNFWGGHGLHLTVLSTLFGKEMMWAIALVIAHWITTLLLTQPIQTNSESPCQNRIALF